MMTYKKVISGYYNALAAGLGLSNSGVQLVQPAIVPPDDTSLWTFLDQLPPVSLYRNIGESTAKGSFFETYKQILASLQVPSKNRFQEAVGQEVADNFIRFLSTRPGELPSANKYPVMFRSWAMLHHPRVANQGTTALAAMLLEPIAAALVSLLGYKDHSTEPPGVGRFPDWDESYDELLTSLKSSPSREFSVTTATIVSDVTSTWANGRIGDHAGLWNLSSPASEQAELFATNEFRLHVSIGHVLLFRPVPGVWYSSSALDLAYSRPEIPPWASGASLDWNESFGINGIMRYITNGLIIVDSFDAKIISAGPYSQEDQEVILKNQSSGLWPLYMNTNAENRCSFSQDGALEIRISTNAGVPVLIGTIATPIEQYLGHSDST